MKDLEQSPDFEKLDICDLDMLRQFNKPRLCQFMRTRQDSKPAIQTDGERLTQFYEQVTSLLLYSFQLNEIIYCY